MKKYYLLRFDDITPQMAWSSFNPLKDSLEKLSISSILGVVPDCKDENLNVEEYNNDFFNMVRSYKSYGDTIAQHGTNHLYAKNNSGLLNINNFSEFAGLSYDEQFNKLKQGKEILQAESIWEPFFMAPAHSFDTNTLKALYSLDFKAITDGYGFYPYCKEKMILVPQLFSKPMDFGFGINTICLHINTMTQQQIDDVLSFVKSNQKYFINFNQAIELTPKNIMTKTFSVFSRNLSNIAIQSLRKIKR